MNATWKTMTIISGAVVVFGALEAQLWSSSSDYLFWLGNSSAPYLALAFISGYALSRQQANVFVVLVFAIFATLLALGVFYAWTIATGSLYIGSAALVAGKYVLGGTITGPVFGFLGWLSARVHVPLGTIVGLMFILEPLAWKVYGSGRVMPLTYVLTQIAIGLSLAAVAFYRWRVTGKT